MLEATVQSNRQRLLESRLRSAFPDIEAEEDALRIRLSHLPGTSCPGLLMQELERLDGLTHPLLEEGYELTGDLALESGLLLRRPEADEISFPTHWPPA